MLCLFRSVCGSELKLSSKVYTSICKTQLSNRPLQITWPVKQDARWSTGLGTLSICYQLIFVTMIILEPNFDCQPSYGKK